MRGFKGTRHDRPPGRRRRPTGAGVTLVPPGASKSRALQAWQSPPWAAESSKPTRPAVRCSDLAARMRRIHCPRGAVGCLCVVCMRSRHALAFGLVLAPGLCIGSTGARPAGTGAAFAIGMRTWLGCAKTCKGLGGTSTARPVGHRPNCFNEARFASTKQTLLHPSTLASRNPPLAIRADSLKQTLLQWSERCSIETTQQRTRSSPIKKVQWVGFVRLQRGPAGSVDRA